MIDVVVNGNKPLAEGVAAAARSQTGSKAVRVWHVAVGDKAHAWNQYIYDIWPGSGIAFFVDGYVRVNADAFALVGESMDRSEQALAGTGVPTQGRSADAMRAVMISRGGIHGNLYALRGNTIAELRRRGFRVPRGIYRLDPLVGAVLCFGLDPAKHKWNTQRVVVSPTASWSVPLSSVNSLRDLKTQFNRTVRQARGRFESRSFREHLSVEKRSPESLPETVRELVVGWIRNHPIAALRLAFTDPLSIIALYKLWKQQDWSQKDVPPALVSTIFC